MALSSNLQPVSCTCRMLSEFFAHCDFIVCLLTDDGHTDDENDDTEYNFMAEDQKEEMEEYRNDRAVRIPRK